MKTLVLGLGNPILCDDSVGIRVARALNGRLDGKEVSVVEASVGGLNMLDILAGYDRAFIIDAIQTVGGEPGQIYHLEPDSFDTTRHNAVTHGIDFTTAIELGRRLGLDLPTKITVFGIEVEDVSSFSEQCTPDVERAIPVCAEMVLQELVVSVDRESRVGTPNTS